MSKLIRKLNILGSTKDAQSIPDTSEKIPSIRELRINSHSFNSKQDFPDNFLKTSKYKPYTFICVNLYGQFRRTANFYFLCITLMQLIPDVSPYPLYVTVAPLAFILGITMLKEGYEDYLRHNRDEKDGNKVYDTVSETNGSFIPTKSKDIQVGDIIWLKSNAEVPADVVVRIDLDDVFQENLQIKLN